MVFRGATLSWKVGDDDGGGKSEILWRNSVTGHTVPWLMDGFTKVATGSIGVVGSDWEVQ